MPRFDVDMAISTDLLSYLLASEIEVNQKLSNFRSSFTGEKGSSYFAEMEIINLYDFWKEQVDIVYKRMLLIPLESIINTYHIESTIRQFVMDRAAKTNNTKKYYNLHIEQFKKIEAAITEGNRVVVTKFNEYTKGRRSSYFKIIRDICFVIIGIGATLFTQYIMRLLGWIK